MKKINLYAATALIGLSGATTANAQSIDYEMMESIFGEKVTASATGKPQRVSDAPVDMIIIGQDEIEKSGAQDIPQLLQKYAGISVNRSFKHSADVNVRGYNSNYSNKLLVLVNGRQVYQDYYSFTAWESLPVQLSEIRQIEVVKGPNTSLFGLNAESGVINIITYSPLDDKISNVEVKAGTQDAKEAIGVVTAKPTDNFAFRLSAATKSSDLFTVDDEIAAYGLDRNDGLTKKTFNLDSEWQVDGTTNVRFQAGNVNSKGAEVIPFLWTQASSKKDFGYLQGTVLKDTAYGLFKVNAYHNTSDAKITNMSLTNDLNVLQLENLKRLDKDNTVRIGAEYRKSTAEGFSISPLGGDLTSELMGIAGMWEHVYNDKLTFTNSLRFDHLAVEKSDALTIGTMLPASEFDQEFNEISFNSGALYKLNDLESIRVNAGRGVHLPSLLEIGGNNDDVIDFYGNPYLDPEVMWSAEVGYNRVLPQIQGKVKTTVFYQYIEDFIAKTIIPVPAASSPQVYSINAGSSQAVGLELSVDGKYNENISYGSSYTFTHTDDSEDVKDTMFNDDNNNQHKVALWAGYEKDKFSAYVEGIWTSAIDYRNQTKLVDISPAPSPVFEDKVGSYITLNTNVSYDLTDQAKISLAGYNLLDEHKEYPSGYNAVPGNSYGGNTLGRAALVTFKYKF